MIFSILIATLESRKEQFNKLESFLKKQIKDNSLDNEVEIIVFEDDKVYPIGMKRNMLLAAATGKFIAFIDDDDWVVDDYIPLIVKTIKENPEIDCIGIKGLLVSNDIGNKEFIHSVKYNEYTEDSNYFFRPCNHLNPLRRELIKKYQFPIINFSEDFDWAMKICKDGILKKEVFIDKVMYFYNFEYAKSATAGTERRE